MRTFEERTQLKPHLDLMTLVACMYVGFRLALRAGWKVLERGRSGKRHEISQGFEVGVVTRVFCSEAEACDLRAACTQLLMLARSGLELLETTFGLSGIKILTLVFSAQSVVYRARSP